MISLKVQSQSAKIFDSCESCCCEQIAIKHMSSEQVVIDFSPWAMPIAPRGLTKTIIHSSLISKNVTQLYDIEKFENKINNPLDKSQSFDFRVNPQINGNSYEYLAEIVSENDINYDGILHWRSDSVNEWYYSKNKDWSNKKLYLATNVCRAENSEIEKEFIRIKKSLLDRYILQLNMWLTPFSYEGSVIRLNIKQYAEDCDCNIFTKDLCIDITVVKC